MENVNKKKLGEKKQQHKEKKLDCVQDQELQRIQIAQ